MTYSTAPAPIRVPVVCIQCGDRAYIWIAPEEIAAMEFTYSEPKAAYLHTCAACLYQTTPTDAPLNIPRSHDPERSAHAARTSGAYHTAEWRMR